jgi:hypothetical protein
MVLIGRIFVILFAVWVATIVAGIVVSIGLLGPQWTASSGDPGDRIVLWGAAFLASGLTATLIFMPMLIAVVLTEVFALRALLIYAAGGAAIMLLAYQGVGSGRYEESIDRAPPPLSRNTEIAAGAGAAFGLTYWLIAGRRAGRWRERA